MTNESEVLMAIGRVEGKVDSLINLEERVHKELKEQEGRIARLERWQSRVLGAIGVLGSSLLYSLFGGPDVGSS